MFCQHCGTKIEDDMRFCPVCGEQVEPEPSSAPQDSARSLEAEMQDHALSMNPGMQNAEPETQSAAQDTQPQGMEPGQNAQSPQKKHMGGFAVFMIFILIAAVIVGAIGFGIWSFWKKATNPGDSMQQAVEQFAEEKEPEDKADAVDLADVDINAVTTGTCTLRGRLSETAEGELMLTLDEKCNIYTYDENMEKIIVKDVKAVYVDDDMLEDGTAEAAKKEQEITVKGSIYAEEKSVYIEASAMQDKDGGEITAGGLDDEDGYVIADSDSRLLTGADIADLSLQELNYAKNEIYARHGRKFDSPELQKYFGGKSWYNGTISPDSFSEGILSDTEKKNAEFLSNAEFNRSPGGYKLDAN